MYNTRRELVKDVFQKKSKLQVHQNKCRRFCLNLNNRAHIGRNEFEQINWLPLNDSFEQLISSMSFKFCNNASPPNMNDVFKPAGQSNTLLEHLC